MRFLSLRRLVSAIGLCVAITTAVSVPTGYMVVGYTNAISVLDAKAELTARSLTRYIYSQGADWQYQPHRIIQLLEEIEDKSGNTRKRIFGSRGELVLEEGPEIAAPALVRDAPIVVSGTTVGRVEIETSVHQLLAGAGVVALLSSMLGFAMYLAVRVFPLKVLDRTIGALEQTSGQFGAALNNMLQGLIMLDAQQRLIVWNERFVSMFHLKPDAIRPLMSIGELHEIVIDNNTLSREKSDNFIAERQRVWDIGKSTIVLRELADGRVISILHAPIPTGGWLTTYEDITERRAAEAKIAHMAHHDGLTNLPNRLLFRERMEETLRGMRRDEWVAVLCLDLDHFKEVNDTLGHGIGDELLKAVGRRLSECIRESDVIARLGGDEFAIMQVGAGDQPIEATALASRLIEIVGAPYDLEGHQVVIGVSVGIAIAPTDRSDPQQLMKNADMALYRAKADGRSTYRFFEPEMDARAQTRRRLELDLRAALKNEEFELYYQPIIELRTDEIIAFEALVRWHHPQRGMIAPLDFIPLAEETGLIVPLGEWVLRKACADASTWSQQVRIAVNVSPVQFKNRHLVQAVFTAIAKSGLAPERLELEITEAALLQDTGATLAILHALRNFGVRISMDDFGTGYSSLSYLRSFPFDKIKIDRSFIHDMSTNEDCVGIVRAVAGLGHSLGIATTAEGVETNEQLKLLQMEGCTEVQGYLFSPPRPAAEVEELLARTSKQWAVA